MKIKTNIVEILIVILCLTIGVLACVSANAKGQKVYPDPILATVVSVYDGDTITVDVDSLPEVFGDDLGIRIYGVDTPEMKGPFKKEATKARDFVRSLCKIGDKIQLSNIRRDKYFRLDADVFCSGKNVGEELLRLGMGKPYFGGTKL